jgi:hypothetical protein
MTLNFHPAADEARTGLPQRTAQDPLVDAIAQSIRRCLSRLVWTVFAWGLVILLLVALGVIGLMIGCNWPTSTVSRPANTFGCSSNSTFMAH